jgi:hypothetical protein
VWEIDADGLSELSPVPAGDSANSTKVNANLHTVSVSFAISSWSLAASRPNLSRDLLSARLVRLGTAPSSVQLHTEFTAATTPSTRRNSMVLSL